MTAKTSTLFRRGGLAAALSLGLCGCVSIFPKTKPIQLYAFGQLPPDTPSQTQANAQANPQAGAVGVFLSTISMPASAVGDQLLTLTGQQAAYIGGARWVVPAGLMMQADAERAFEAKSQRVRLLHRGDFGGAGALLHLDVGDFEARYDAPGAAPTVVVSLRATLTRPGGDLVAERTFTIRQPAEDNRIAPIAAAYDKAVIDVLGRVVEWTDTNAPAVSPPPPSATVSTGKPPPH